jgi:hypothetical protein
MREERVEEDDVAIMELLTRLQRRYDAEDALTAARVLYDIEDSEDEDEKGTPNQPYIKDHPAPTVPVTPSKPPRPPPELLRGLLEISPPALSTSTSREDTSADSRLAAWLERIAQDQKLKGGVVPQASKEAIPKELHQTQIALPSLSPLDAHESRVGRSSMPPSALKFYPITPLSGRPRSTAQALFKRERAFSAPATSFSDISMYSQPSSLVRQKHVRFDVSTGSDSSLNITLARTRNSSLVETSMNLSSPSAYDSASDISADESPPFIPPLDFSLAEPSFIEVPWMQELSPLADGNLRFCRFPLPLNGLIETEETPWFPKTPLHTTADNSRVNEADGPPTFHSVSISSEFIEAFESARDDDDFDRHVGALRDLSGIYATNLALQHTSKSPMLVRNWQRVLDELTGRSGKEAPRIRPDMESEFANKEALWQDFDAHATALGLGGTTDISEIKVGAVLSGPTLDTSGRENTPAHSLIDTRPFPYYKTQADRGLDREFIHYLRLSIERKRTEVEVLKKLETQRLKVIHRLERVLSRKTLELLTSDPS